MNRLAHYYTRMRQLGLRQSYRRLCERTKNAFIHAYWHKKAQYGRINHTWSQVCKKLEITLPYDQVIEAIHRDDMIHRLIESPLFKAIIPALYHDHEQLIHEANTLLNGKITLLGVTITHDPSGYPQWHHDARCMQNLFPRASMRPHVEQPLWQSTTTLYYKNVMHRFAEQMPEDAYYADLKIPWELSRLQHLTLLAYTYHTTRREHYAVACIQHILDWIDKNPCMRGVTWACPMDVGIRAINIVWCVHLCKGSAILTLSTWKRILCSLYDHFFYLERNWETSDKPSNHYLSDLIGYLYLSDFFSCIADLAAQRSWCKKELYAQADHQLLADGTSYEGSTHYHKLVTEIFLHFSLLTQNDREEERDRRFGDRLKKAVRFLYDCTDEKGNLIQIGDNDSGKIVTGLQTTTIDKALAFLNDDAAHKNESGIDTPPKSVLTHYTHFGLSIIKTTRWHISLRHPTFQLQQPSGHFHHDQLALTVHIEGRPVLVDSGSFLYTANDTWRNRFRAVENHTTFHLVDQLGVGTAPFQLPRSVHTPHVMPLALPDYDEMFYTTVHTWHDEHANRGLQAHRSIHLAPDMSHLIINDWWQGTKDFSESFVKTMWNFIFHPDIRIEQASDTTWFICADQKKIATITTTFPFVQKPAWYSPHYGTMQGCLRLQSEQLRLPSSMVTCISINL